MELAAPCLSPPPALTSGRPAIIFTYRSTSLGYPILVYLGGRPVCEACQPLSTGSNCVFCEIVAGSSPAQMLDDRALLEARRLLLYSQLSVTEVAYAVGFEDAAYFSRFFTRHVGQPPRAYRAARGG